MKKDKTTDAATNVSSTGIPSRDETTSTTRLKQNPNSEKSPSPFYDGNTGAAKSSKDETTSTTRLKQYSSSEKTSPKLRQTPSLVKDDDAYSIKHEISQFLDRMNNSLEDLENYPGAERTQYDFSSDRYSNMYTTNFVESVAHMLKGVLGVGILSMHEAYMQGGTWTSLGATAVIGIVAPYNALMLVATAQNTYKWLRISKLSYADLMETAVAAGPEVLRKHRRKFRYIIEIFLFIELCSTCNVYQITMASLVKKAMEAISDTVNEWQLHLRIYTLIVAVPLILLCIIKHLKYMAALSILADLFIVFCVVIALTYTAKEKSSILERPAWKSVHGFFRFCGILIYSIDCITLALPIENHMKKPLFFPLVVWLTIPLVILACTAVGFFGYWKWGEECISPIIFHLPLTVGTVIMYFVFTIVLAVTYSVQFWVPFKIIWRYGRKKIKRRRYCEPLWRAGLVVFITICSVAFPSVGRFISLIGNVLLGFITFIFPAIIHFLLAHKEYPSLCRRSMDVFSFILGWCFVCGGLYTIFKK